MRIFLVLFVLASFAVLAGCTGSDGNSSGGTSYYVSPNPVPPPPDSDQTSGPSNSILQQTHSQDQFDWHNSTQSENSWDSGFDSDQGGETELGYASENYFDTQSVYCGEEQCPNGIGLLLTTNLQRQVLGCTAFLIDSDVAMTDSHCIPDDLRDPSNNPEGRMQIKFPDTDETMDVAHVAFASDLSNKDTFNPDYAILQLAKTSMNAPLTLTRSGVRNNSMVTIWRVSPPTIKGGSESLASTTCKATQQTSLFPEFENDQSPLVSLTDCSVVEGNSGSPVFNENNEVVGILKGYFKIENTPVGENMNPKDISELPRVALVSNLSCIKDFSSNPAPLPKACNEDLSSKGYYGEFQKRYTAAMARTKSNVDTQVQDLMQKWSEQNSSVFRWKFTSESAIAGAAASTDHPSFLPSVDCIQPVGQWINNYKTLGYFNRLSATVSGSFYTFGAGVGSDSQFDLYPAARAWEMGTYEIKFDPSEISKTGIDHITLTEKMDLLGKEIDLPMPFTVSVCK